MDIKELVENEVKTLKEGLEAQVNDPEERAAIAMMMNDLAMVPIWMAEGTDMSLLLGNLKAEAALRGVTFTVRAENLVKKAWINVLTRVIGAAISGAIA